MNCDQENRVMLFDEEKLHGWQGSRRRLYRVPLPLLLSLLLPWSSVPTMTTATSVYGGIKESGMTRATSAIADEKRQLPEIDSRHKTNHYNGGDHDDKVRDGEHDKGATDSDGVAKIICWTGMVATTIEYSVESQQTYYDESVDETFISTSWTCYWPLMLLALVWIVGPLICLIFCDSKENYGIILKDSHCHCAAKYTNH